MSVKKSKDDFHTTAVPEHISSLGQLHYAYSSIRKAIGRKVSGHDL